jgi:hypothetical protein
MDAAIHPNLAQIAASYDDICEQVNMGIMSGPDARRAVMALVARDDQGVQWLISPDDGNWYRRTLTGELVSDTPPTSGIATPSGWDVSGAEQIEDPRRRVWGFNVEGDAGRQTGELHGSTVAALRVQHTTKRNLGLAGNKAVRAAVAVFAVLALLAAGWMLLGPSSEPEPVPQQPTTTTVAVPAAPGQEPQPGG